VKTTYDFEPKVLESIQGGFDLEEFAFVYPREWLAVAVLEERMGRPVRGYLLAHDKDRASVERSMRQFTNQRILFFYSGAKLKNSHAWA
jgi:hypothetical protein